jgi:hypothetical protein
MVDHVSNKDDRPTISKSPKTNPLCGPQASRLEGFLRYSVL